MGDYKNIAKRASCIVEGALNGDVSKLNAKELGEMADFVKDMEEAEMYCEQAKYYKKITEAMEESSFEEKDYYMTKYSPEYNMSKGYTRMGKPMPMYNGFKYYNGMKYKDLMEYEPYYNEMYYTTNNSNATNGNNGMSNNRMYYNGKMPNHMMGVDKMGRSYMSRKSYMDMKENGADKESTMHELEKYIQELGSDITEMLENATPEERQSAKQKLLTLSTKIQ